MTLHTAELTGLGAASKKLRTVHCAKEARDSFQSPFDRRQPITLASIASPVAAFRHSPTVQ
jgi:hypothetical protein